MNSPVATAIRLLDALDELVEQETFLIRTMDFVEAVRVRERAAPLVEQLCLLAADPAVQALRPRFAGLIERSGQSQQTLDEQLDQLRGELNRLGEARGCLRRMAPAYRAGAIPVESRLNTAA